VVIIKHLLPVCSSHCCNCLSYSIIKLLFCVPCSIVSLTSDLLCFSSRLIRAIIWPTSGMFIWRRMEEYPWLDCLWPNVNTLLMQLLTPTTMSVERMMNRHYNQQAKKFITKLFYWVDIILRKFCNNVHWYLTETNPCKPSFDWGYLLHPSWAKLYFHWSWYQFLLFSRHSPFGDRFHLY